ncbi:MAG: hypothetical protein R6X19_06515 [Kiritimatiellia bacterium]
MSRKLMIPFRSPDPSRNAGSALLLAVVMLGVAAFIVASIFTTMTHFTKSSERQYCLDKAALLAEAGIHAAVIQLNRDSNGDITFTESRNCFSNQSNFAYADWGFTTSVQFTNGTHRIQSTGRYNGSRVDVQSSVAMNTASDSVHAIYSHALFAGNFKGTSNYVLKIGGTGKGYDYVRGDTYSGGAIELTGAATLRLPEIMPDANKNGIWEEGDPWTDAYTSQSFTNPLSKTDFDAYRKNILPSLSKTYSNGRYDYGEAFVDTIGNGVYDEGESYTDSNGNGVRDPGDSFIDRNGNGVYNVGIDTVVDCGNGRWDAGETWVEDAAHSQRVNGRYDRAGGYYRYGSGCWSWRTSYTSNFRTYSCASWPAEAFVDEGDGAYNPSGEPYVDQNGVYDPGEEYVDDRNGIYDYGTQAKGVISGMPAPGPGQKYTTGRDAPLDPPNLANMYYAVSHNSPQPANALTRWGHDVAVTASDFGVAKAILDTTRPEHIFVRNPPASGSTTSGGKMIYGRTYTVVTNAAGKRQDDYFLEDPTDSTYNKSVEADAIDGTVYTAPMYINVKPEDNNKLYYVEGNVYLHNPQVYSLRFRKPGTTITIVASGNITISDEFYYNAAYAPGLARSNMNSTIVNNPSDALCLIALKNPAFPNSGNIFIGDSQFGTGGSIHALLYAENDFVDNNLNTADQSFISVFGNMTAGNQVRLNRPTGAGQYRTRLDITLDDRIRDEKASVPGLPHPACFQRGITSQSNWELVPKTWSAFSPIP